MFFFLYFIMVWLAFLPSLIWLWFFLRFDKNPEPRSIIARVFLWGMLTGPIAFILESIFMGLIKYLTMSRGIILNWMLVGVVVVAPLIEEILKYGAAKIGYWEFPAEFDEPIDFMIYLVTAGLGFAAIENVRYLLTVVSQSNGLAGGLINGIILLIGRFLTSTFLHALTASVIGFFVAISWKYQKQRLFLLLIGLISAISIHAVYNCYNLYFIQNNNNLTGIGLLICLLIILLMFIIYAFKKISKVKSICLSNCLSKIKINKLKVRKIYE